MNRSLRAIGCAMLLLLVGGCDLRTLHIMLVGFRSGDVDGIWLWREQANGEYVRLCRFLLSNSFFHYDVEVVAYAQFCTDDTSPSSVMHAEIVRDTVASGAAFLRLEYQRGSRTIGTYRASAYNRSGESGLSSAAVQL